MPPTTGNSILSYLARRCFRLASNFTALMNRLQREGSHRSHPFRPSVEALEDRLVLDNSSADTVGILARGLKRFDGTTVLTGAGINIGQVEASRPTKPGYDKFFSHPDVTPVDVFKRDLQDIPDGFYGDHANYVAGVMTANGAADQGIAPKANLYSSAHAAGVADQDWALVSMQKVATVKNDIRAINLSFGQELGKRDKLDGNSLLSLGLDWSARKHNVLYVIAGNEPSPDRKDLPVPSDSYNGVVVAYSKKVDGAFRRLSENNVTKFQPLNNRHSVDLVAPGDAIKVPPRAKARNPKPADLAYVPQSGCRATGKMSPFCHSDSVTR